MVGVVPPEEYLEKNGWVLGPPVEGDQVCSLLQSFHPYNTDESLQDGMPTLARIFTPTIADFPPHIATTNVSVDELVNECYRVGYVTVRPQDAPRVNNHGSLNMVSMPTASTTTANPFDTSLSANNATEDLQQTSLDAAAFSPYWPTDNVDVEPEYTVPAPPAAAQRVLAQASADLGNAGSSYPHFDMFTPDSDLVGWNPSAADDTVADGGMWDAIDFDAFVSSDE